MAVIGENELIANLEHLEKTEEKKARKATRDGAKVFEDKLKANTPVSPEDHSGMTSLREHTKKGNLKTAAGEYQVDVGYDKKKGWVAHFPNAGTAKQRPQHFIEKSQEESKKDILGKFVEDLQV